MCSADAKITDALGPVVLVVVLGDDDLQCARSRGRSRGAGTAVMDNGRDSRKEGLLVDLADGQAVGPVVCGQHVRPSTRHHQAASEDAGGLDH